MNRSLWTYMIRDAREGIKRNLGASVAAAALIFVSMVILSTMLLVRWGADHLTEYLESQVTLKVYVDPKVDTGEVASILASKPFVQSLETETKEELLTRLSSFFAGREHLLQSFQESAIPDSIRLELRDKKQIAQVAAELEKVSGITKVIYPQQFAETILWWSDTIHQSGLLLLAFFVAISFGMVFIAMNLSLYQRQQEIRVRLLLGANPRQVRGQFLFEGWLIGLGGSLLAAIVVSLFFDRLLLPLQRQFPAVFHFPPQMMYAILTGTVLAGSLIGMAASYESTRKLIRDA